MPTNETARSFGNMLNEYIPKKSPWAGMHKKDEDDLENPPVSVSGTNIVDKGKARQFMRGFFGAKD